MNYTINPGRNLLYTRAIFAFIAFSVLSFTAKAQITVSANKTAAILASTLTGAGVTVLSPVLTCPGPANGTFVTGAIDPVGIATGVVLTCGSVIDTLGNTGIAHPASTFASSGYSLGGDASLATLAGTTITNTYDACVLEFDFKAAGDTVKFNYVFASEEYPEFACSGFNDVFGFLISGGAYATPTNIARIPGTTIPVCINSVNSAPTGTSYPVSTCASVGAGCPYSIYYINNAASTLLVYDGMTTVLQAIAAVNPCDTYHLKLGIADVGDGAYDSGVFIEGGSLTSNVPTAVTATGTSGLPYCIRGCAPGNFVFSTPVPQDTAIVIHYIITGTAANGYDYATIPDSVIIAPSTTSTILNINTLTVPAVGPKVITLEIEIPDPCHPGVYTIGAVANLTILDSFAFHIITPDTSICSGQFVHIIAVGDTIFDSILHYTWTPGSTISNDTILTPNATPTSTTVYTLTGTTAAVLGCAPKSHTVKISIYNPSLDSVNHINPSVCGYCDGSITLWGLQTGFSDTVFYTFNGVPQPPLPMTVTAGHTITITGLCAGVYSNIYVKVGICTTLPKGPVTLVNPPPPVVTVDSPVVKTCVGISVQLHAFATPSGVPYFYTWTPPTDLNNTTVSNPIVTPSAPGDIIYTVTVNPGVNPACASTATIDVHAIGPYTLFNHDTIICVGAAVQVNISGSGEYSWLWTPSDWVSNTTIMNPIMTPDTSRTYTVTATYAHCPPVVRSFNVEVDYPAPTDIITDTVCVGMTYTTDVTVPGGDYYHYQWTPPLFVSNDTIPNPIITPTVAGSYAYTITIQPHAASCAIIDLLNLQVYPNKINLLTPDTAICRGQSVQVLANGDPIFAYQWLPTAGIAMSNVVAPLITPDTSATYIVSASYYKCPDIFDTLRIDVQPNPEIYIAGRTTVCQYDSIHLEAYVTPRWYEHYSYNWVPGGNIDATNASAIVFTATSVTNATLIVTVSTPAGCTAVDSTKITVFPGDFAALAPNIKDFCPHDTALLVPTGGVAYHWSPSLYLSDSMGLTPVIRPITNQTYSIVATSADGCRDTLTYTAIVHPSGLISIPDSASIYPGESYQISPLTNCNSFLWFPPAGLSNAYISNPLATPEVNTKYIVYGFTEWGCRAVDSINIYVDMESVIDIPNAFTPGTGPNKDFKIIKRGIATLNYFRIFNRWGNLVFETKDIDKGWNGEYNGVPQPFGVFVYQIEAVTNTGKIFTKHGNTTLIR